MYGGGPEYNLARWGRVYTVVGGVCGEINRAMPVALMIAANNFPNHHMLPNTPLFLIWNLALAATA